MYVRVLRFTRVARYLLRVNIVIRICRVEIRRVVEVLPECRRRRGSVAHRP
jgi:hypothetical protein